jgi:hypothetical protein
MKSIDSVSNGMSFSIQSQIKQNSAQIEKMYLALADIFSSLLNSKGRTSLEELQEMFVSLNGKSESSSVQGQEVVQGFKTKYASLFDKLNEKITELDALNKEVSGIKDDSEEMELITLNAMVVSIKSGDKGRAFSCIADNMKRLSNQMFLFSDSLFSEEQKLIQNITELQEIFNGIVSSQNKLASMENDSALALKSFITNASVPLDDMTRLARSVYAPIQKTMEGLQSQDIIRQALDHVLICLDESTNVDAPEEDSSPHVLDEVCFNIELYGISKKVIEDVMAELDKTVGQYKKNWAELTATLSSLDAKKTQYIENNLNAKNKSENMVARINTIIQSFAEQMDEFNNYYLTQKNLEFTCKDITSGTRIMYRVFENLEPIVNGLHHVRLLQQIEVAKNEAIASVKDSVSVMDHYIEAAKNSLDQIQTMLDNFTAQTDVLLEDFQSEVTKDNARMMQGKKVKNAFFADLKEGCGQISTILHNFTVLPAGFENECRRVQDEIGSLDEMKNDFAQIESVLAQKQQALIQSRDNKLAKNNMTEWTITNDKFKQVIQHFTITAHKEAAGEIGGFSVEKGSAAGEVTFF